MNAKVIDMAGKRFANIIAIRVEGKSTSGDLNWRFVCDCGTEFSANGYYARSGKITTCPECSKERVRLASVKHGMSDSVEFGIWTDIQTRCHNPGAACYDRYGGRGIAVCQRWRDSFLHFLEDMGKRPSKDHSIDRYPDNNGNYEPSNCRWATRHEQANNKRNNLSFSINGEHKTIPQLVQETGLSYFCIWNRSRIGRTGEDLITESRTRNKHGR